MNSMKHILVATIVVLTTNTLFAQDRKTVMDDTIKTVQDGIYNRPFIGVGQTGVAVGGYVEGNTNYFSEDGISDGFSMELRRFNLFVYSRIGQRIRFISELEFEHGTEEIALETAALDFMIDPALNVRVGILLPPVGGFNVNHDSPQWEFVERPLVSTHIIPATLSEVGFGVNGKFYKSNWIVSYDAYIVNGLRDEVIFNGEGRTFLAAGKSEEMFAEDNNGRPMYTGRVGVRHRNIGEAGLSFYGGTYNTFRLDGEEIDAKRDLWITALDVRASVGKLQVNGEYALSFIDIPSNAAEFFGEKQFGGFTEFIYPFLNKNILKFENTVFNALLRLEYVDFNIGNFSSTGQNIGDDITAIATGISIRPHPSTVIKINYRHEWIKDVLDNPTVKRAGFQVGFASYF